MSTRFRLVQSITMKRKGIDPTANDQSPFGKYGHWWLEIGDPMDEDSESYGWWPERPVNAADAIVGISGV